MTARFLTPLRMEQVGADQFDLTSDLIFYSEKFRGTCTAKAGYRSDFASIPKILGSITPKYGGFNAAAVIHDAALTDDLYADNGYRQTWVRGYANDLFSEGLQACGVTWWRRKLMMAAVRMFADKSHPSVKGQAA
jgi:hypothetical protein